MTEVDLKDATEVIRAFLPGKEEIVGGIYIDPPANLQPFGFGILLADLVHHAANAYAYKFGLDAEQVRDGIAAGLQAELSSPTDTVKQVYPEGRH
ncbi:DUF5076 domain-containing protein [Novosphingobium naphthalenivorans]|uniref:DUF5076 domain-containing protein n=1 Tax=Novosphingobium naphthalenivorans TaxID=273168 RepID=UPI0014720538|nr:DUF5076 domain-containing protein [Novosphingobium naphthalenivorans]